jgi:hypothetical protein
MGSWPPLCDVRHTVSNGTDLLATELPTISRKLCAIFLPDYTNKSVTGQGGFIAKSTHHKTLERKYNNVTTMPSVHKDLKTLDKTSLLLLSTGNFITKCRVQGFL